MVIEYYLCHLGCHFILSSREDNEMGLLVHFISENRTVVWTSKSVHSNVLASYAREKRLWSEKQG